MQVPNHDPIFQYKAQNVVSPQLFQTSFANENNVKTFPLLKWAMQSLQRKRKEALFIHVVFFDGTHQIHN